MDYVINYDLPDSPENYVHRCGRTGRGQQTGQALSFCSEEEVAFLDAIEAYTGEEILRYDIDAKDYMSIIEDTEDLNYNWKKLIEENSDPDEWFDK
jgi:ATP-dependent RNA helicase RhlE